MWNNVPFIQAKEFLDGKPLKVTAFGRIWNTEFYVERYKEGALALLLVITDGENAGDDFGTLTVNIPDVLLRGHEVLIKNWSENEEMAKAALESDLFIDTGKRVATGFVEAPIWEINFDHDR